jgi:rod shape-determining protein MreD
MSLIVMALLLLGATVLQAGLPAYAFMGQARPPLLLAVAMYYALSRGPSLALTAALAAGLLQDALSEIPLGWSVTAFALVVLLAGRYGNIITSEHFWPHALLGALAAFAVTVALYAGLRAVGSVACPWEWALLKSAWTAGCGAVATPLVCAAANRLDAFAGCVPVWEDVTGLE